MFIAMFTVFINQLLTKTFLFSKLRFSIEIFNTFVFVLIVLFFITELKDFQKRFIFRQSRTNQFVENKFVIQFIKKREFEKNVKNVADFDVVKKSKNKFDHNENRFEI